MPVDQRVLDEIALSRAEYDLIVQRLGREPSDVELGMFGALWSEHCGYKHSKPLLKLFPSKGPRVLVGPGAENAGAVDIGDGVAVVMKMESHNHPSAIEPYQGAATGVGGIVRDIFTMGARPVALLNSLRFGPLSEPRNRYLFGGVVAGIAGYGNCLGIPDVAGEVCFSPAYSHNPLVNAMCVGLTEARSLVRGQARGLGNLLMLVGSDTGRDGIHGASGLASRTFEAGRELRPTVQVGNPFLEKLLLEACLELVGRDYVVGINDLGAAGLTSSAVEAAARGGSGLDIDVLQVPRREQDMTAYEVMLSESQERMLVAVKQGFEDRVEAVFRRWGLSSVVLGRVTSDGMARVREGDRQVAEVPVALFTDPPQYRLEGRMPKELQPHREKRLDLLRDLPEEPGQLLLRLLASPNIASKEWVYRQYDHQVLTNTVVSPGAADAAVLRVRGTPRGIALATDGNGRLCYLDPYVGGALAVAEAARNVACVGARPLALTDCLNFGNPENPGVYWQLEQAIRGMADACRRLDVPVISGNVSLYNETQGKPIYPTPVVGMLGLVDDAARHCTSGFKCPGDVVALLGGGADPQGGLAGSEYLEVAHGLVVGKPVVDLAAEARVQRVVVEAISRGLLHSAHDCADGGLAVALAECSILGGMGFQGQVPLVAGRGDASLFGEAASRIVVSVARADQTNLEGLARAHGVPCQVLGRVGNARFALKGYLDLPLTRLAAAWRGGLEDALKGLP
ncbi:MAG: phosphoribosylformylglycinamidine synthase subunit PurL [Chloroflexi bacterium]|nr:phosphoribosylformylglycinamidine synthase subunit PurL [Chloroflexota bacterium]